MASTDKPEVPYKPEEAPPPPPPPASPCWKDCFAADVALRVLLLAAAITAVVVMVTSKQTKQFPVSGPLVPAIPAKFNHSPAFIYFVAALSVAGLYSIITIIASISVILKPDYSKKFLLHFAFWDVLILGIVASAMGAAAAIAYTDLKGNRHVSWNKVCSVYDKHCRQLAASVAVALFATVLLVLLCWLSILSLHRRIRD